MYIQMRIYLLRVVIPVYLHLYATYVRAPTPQNPYLIFITEKVLDPKVYTIRKVHDRVIHRDSSESLVIILVVVLNPVRTRAKGQHPFDNRLWRRCPCRGRIIIKFGRSVGRNGDFYRRLSKPSPKLFNNRSGSDSLHIFH